MQHRSLDDFLAYVKARNPAEPEFIQAVTEVMGSLWPFIERNPRYAEEGVLERLVEPERVLMFRVSWLDDAGKVQVNRAWRVQQNSAIGPYKGGMRFHPSVSLSILKFLAFEQTLKNALTTLPLGGGKGGADFNPKGRSRNEIMRFCQALMTELYRHLGSDTDVPAGDIGVGAREVGFMTGAMKKLSNRSDCVFTGKGQSFGGSIMRPESTGYGVVYFAEQMLKRRKLALDGMRVGVSGSGNVAQYAVEKAITLGATVVTVSDSSGTVYDSEGFNLDKLDLLKEVKNVRYGRISEYASQIGADYLPGRKPWHIPLDIALPCATQNELDLDDANQLIANGVRCVVEGANMPTTLEAVHLLEASDVLFAPGKASNAGGVGTSGLEMSQNALRMSWTRGEVDERLHRIMIDIHEACVRHGQRPDGKLSYVDGANIAGFVKVAEAMLAQGVV